MSEQELNNIKFKIKSVSIDNVRCFAKASKISLCEPGKSKPSKWTVILGENGTGKTTLLQSIALSFPSRNLPNPGLRIGLAPLGIMTTVGAKWSHSDIASAWRSREEVEITSQIEHDSKPIPTSWTINYRPIDPNELNKADHYGKLWNTRVHSAPPCVGYGVHRRLAPANLTYSNQTLVGVESLFDESVGLIHPDEIIARTRLIDIERLRLEDETGKHKPERRPTIFNALTKVLPQVEKFKLNVTPTKIRGLYTVRGYDFEFHQLSTGYQSIALWVCDLISRLQQAYPDSNDPCQESAIVLIDEFDQHMHPKWQREVVRFLDETFTNTQFVITSHSPLIIQALEDIGGANIVLLKERNEEGPRVVEIINEPHVTKGWRIDQIITSELFDIDSPYSEYTSSLIRERYNVKELLQSPDQNDTIELMTKLVEIEDKLAVISHLLPFT